MGAFGRSRRNFEKSLADFAEPPHHRQSVTQKMVVRLTLLFLLFAIVVGALVFLFVGKPAWDWVLSRCRGRDAQLAHEEARRRQEELEQRLAREELDRELDEMRINQRS